LAGSLAALLLLCGCSRPQDAPSAQRTLEDLKFEKLPDTPESRAKYPFLVASFDEAKQFNAEFPDSAPTEIYMAVVDRSQSGAPVDFAFVQLQGSYNCGTLGCASGVYGIAPDGSYKPLLDLYSHPVEGANSLSHCGKEISLVIVEGHGMELALTEWRYNGRGFEQIGTYPFPDSSGPPPSLPPCGTKQSGK
jgi:hypothetical protein